ncbi:MAG: hypothetical protein V2J19_00750 [Wenzhouxiangella sp.]|nr:hypothetical protein [Wenzhouxiangella sp.]
MSGNTIRVGSDAGTCDYDNLVDALGAAGNGDTILLESDTSLYLGDTYVLDELSVTIRGGYESCSDITPTGRTTLDADGNSQRVFTILGSGSNPTNVVLDNLAIRGSQLSLEGGGAGLGIAGRQGVLSVDLKNVQIAFNEAVNSGQNGGGVLVVVGGDAMDTSPLITIDNDSMINDNSTTDNGGGIACVNPQEASTAGEVIVIGSAAIANNSAENGGGIALMNCGETLYAGGGPIVFGAPAGAIFGNTASAKGGGLYISGASKLSTRGSEYAPGYGDPDNAGHIVMNEAALGGGIYIDGAEADLQDLVIRDNTATNSGGGIYADNNATVWHGREQEEACQPPESIGIGITVPRCSRMTGNTTVNGGGGGYYVTNGSMLEVQRTIITNNTSSLSGSIVRATSGSTGDPGKANFYDSLAYQNSGSALFYGWQSSQILISRSTITDNTSVDHVLRGFATAPDEALFHIEASIIWESEGHVLTLDGSGNSAASAECVIAHQEASDTDLSSAFYFSSIDPDLTTVDDNPYFPSATSPAIDYCSDSSIAPGNLDLVGVERGSEHLGPDPVDPPNGHTGFHDLGAYETQWSPVADLIFQDRFH